jgi:hypothetical protein
LKHDRRVRGIPRCPPGDCDLGTFAAVLIFFFVVVIVIVVVEEGRVILDLGSVVLEALGNLLLALDEEFREVAMLGELRWRVRCDGIVAIVVEAGGEAAVADAAGTTNAVNIFIDFIGEVVVDDVHDVFDIKTPGSDVSSNEDWSLAIAEGYHRILQLEYCKGWTSRSRWVRSPWIEVHGNLRL